MAAAQPCSEIIDPGLVRVAIDGIPTIEDRDIYYMVRSDLI